MFDINDIERKLRLRLNTIKQGEYLYVKGNIINKPRYPYATIQVIAGYIPEGNGTITRKHIEDIDKLRITRTEYPQCTFSITCHSEDEEQAKRMAMDTLAYLKFTGHQDLARDDIIVLEASNVQDRSIILEGIEYEFRYGLDIRLRVVSELSVDIGYATDVEIINDNEKEWFSWRIQMLL